MPRDGVRGACGCARRCGGVPWRLRDDAIAGRSLRAVESRDVRGQRRRRWQHRQAGRRGVCQVHARTDPHRHIQFLRQHRGPVRRNQQCPGRQWQPRRGRLRPRPAQHHLRAGRHLRPCIDDGHRTAYPGFRHYVRQMGILARSVFFRAAVRTHDGARRNRDGYPRVSRADDIHLHRRAGAQHHLGGRCARISAPTCWTRNRWSTRRRSTATGSSAMPTSGRAATRFTTASRRRRKTTTRSDRVVSVGRAEPAAAHAVSGARHHQCRGT